MLEYDFDKDDYEHIDELIYDKIEEIKDINEIKRLKKEYSYYDYDTSLFDKYIH